MLQKNISFSNLDLKYYPLWSKHVNWQTKDQGILVYYYDGKIAKIFELNRDAKIIWMLFRGDYSLLEIMEYLEFGENKMVDTILNLILNWINERLITLKRQPSFGLPKILIKTFFKEKPWVIFNPQSRLLFKKELKLPITSPTFLGDYFGNRSQFFFPRINLDLTYKCNQNCSHCYYKRYLQGGYVDPSTSNLKKIVDRVAQYPNVKVIEFLGGEPLLRKDILELIRYVQSKDLELVINTNGTLLNEKILNKIKGINPHIFFHVSLDGCKKAHETLRGKGSYGKVVKNIKLATKNGFPVRINYVVHRKNLLDLLIIYILSNQWHVFDLCVIFINRIGDNDAELKKLTLGPLGIFFVYLISLVIRILRKIGVFKTGLKIQKCCAFGFTHIDANGNLHYCSQIPRDMPLGNILEKDLLEIWHSYHYRTLFNREKIGGICRTCMFKEKCELGCRAEIFSLTGDFFEGNPFCFRGKLSNVLQVIFNPLKKCLFPFIRCFILNILS